MAIHCRIAGGGNPVRRGGPSWGRQNLIFAPTTCPSDQGATAALPLRGRARVSSRTTPAPSAIAPAPATTLPATSARVALGPGDADDAERPAPKSTSPPTKTTSPPTVSTAGSAALGRSGGAPGAEGERDGRVTALGHLGGLVGLAVPGGGGDDLVAARVHQARARRRGHVTAVDAQDEVVDVRGVDVEIDQRDAPLELGEGGAHGLHVPLGRRLDRQREEGAEALEGGDEAPRLLLGDAEVVQGERRAVERERPLEALARRRPAPRLGEEGTPP